MFAKLARTVNLVISQGWDFFRPRKKLGIVSLVFLASVIVSAWFIFTPPAQAFGVDDIFSWFATILLAIAGFFIKLTFFVLKFIIEVAGYNGFIDSPAVTVGWVMVRDMTNMFFVVVLLAIAFGTILGLKNYEYTHLLGKLLIAAIVVNFSRLICGLIIDIAQVVMITFINGIAATASGNLVNMFQVDKIFALGAGTGSLGSGSAAFLAGIAAVFFATIMLFTMVAFLFMIMARMAMLWILIVLSPLAFVLNVLPQTESKAHEWWSQFMGNVITGPIIAFFLWLSFVTVGSGSIHDEIKQHNSLPPEHQIQGTSSEEESIGITQVMTWDKMANFLIAIAMLMAGAKVAGEYGAAGGSMIGAAQSMGKKFAMYASGLRAAKWAGVNAVKYGGKGLYHGTNMIPGLKIIHPEQWKRRAAGLKEDIAEKYYGWRGRKAKEAGDMAKEAFAVGEDGKYKKKGTKAWLNRMWTGLRLEAGNYDEFHHEKLEDKKAATEARKEQIPHLISTSSLGVGYKKLANKMRLQELEETGGDIKHGKESVKKEWRDKVMDIIESGKDADGNLTDAAKKQLKGMGLKDGDITDMMSDSGRRGRAAEGKAQAHVTDELLHADKELREAKALKDYIHEEGGHDKEHETAKLKAQAQQIEGTLHAEKELEELKAIRKLLSTAEQKEFNEQKAAVESEKEAIELVKSKDTLLARASQYKQNGEYLRGGLAEQQAHSLELNKIKEIFKSADIGANERANIAAQIMAEIESVRIDPALDSDPIKRTEKLRSLIKQKDSLNDLNSTLGSYDAKREEEEELRTLGWSEQMTSENAARRFLSRKIGRVVGAGQEAAALQEYKDIVGAKEFENRMRQLGAHAKNQIGMGNASAVVFAESPQEVNGKLTGLTNYTPALQTNEKIIVGTLRAYHTGGDLDPAKMREAVGARKLRDGSGSGSVLKHISDAEAEINAEILGSFDTHAVSTMGNKRPFIGDVDSSEIDKESLAVQLSALAKKAKDKSAFIELCTKKLKTIITKHKIQEQELVELFDDTRPDLLSKSQAQPAQTAGSGKKQKGNRRRR